MLAVGCSHILHQVEELYFCVVSLLRLFYHSLLLTFIKCFVVVVQSLSHVQFFVTPWTAACQTSLSFAIFLSLIKLMSIELVMPSNHLILCRSLFLLPAIFPSIRIFSNESTLHIWRPKYWRFSTSLSNAYSGLIPLGLTGLISSLSKGLSRVFSSTTIRKHQFFSAQPSSHSRWNLSSPTRDQTPAPWSGNAES